MGSLVNVLAGIPGYAGYRGAQQLGEEREMGALQQAGALVTLQKQLREQEMERAFKTDLQGLGAEPTQEQLAQVAAKYSKPGEVLRTQQSSLDRQATIEATRASREATLAQNALAAQNQHEFRMRGLTDAAARAEETARHNKAMEALNLQIAQLRTTASQEKPPPGYRKTTEGNLEAIPGGPADTKLTGAFNADTANLESSTAGLNRMAMSANELLNHPGLPRITGAMGALPNMPGSAASDAQAKLENLKSQVGFSVLQAMRDASKTGGALGNVSDAEGKRLEANLAALQNAQSYEQFTAELKKILTFTEEAKDRLRAAYNVKHRDRAAGAAAAPAGGPPKVTNDAEFDALPSGTEFIGPDGKKRRKP